MNKLFSRILSLCLCCCVAASALAPVWEGLPTEEGTAAAEAAAAETAAVRGAYCPPEEGASPGGEATGDTSLPGALIPCDESAGGDALPGGSSLPSAKTSPGGEELPSAKTLPGGETLRSAKAYRHDLAKEMFDMMNAERQKAGVAKLKWLEPLEPAAHVRALESSVYFEHTRPDGRDWTTVCPALMQGENLAFNSRGSTATAMEGLMGSQGHRENILRKEFKGVAVSCYQGADGRWYWVQLFSYAASCTDGWLATNTGPGGNDYDFYYVMKNKLFTGWAQTADKKHTYYMRSDVDGKPGLMALGWQTIKKKSFYFQKKGELMGTMATGWKTISKKSYYFKKTGKPGAMGAMATGWTSLKGKTFYFKKSGKAGVKGKLLTGWQTIGKKNYYFAPEGKAGAKGKMLTGWQTINGKTFYLKKTGKAGVKGRLATGLTTIGGKTYYFNAKGKAGSIGRLRTGWRTVGKHRYYFLPKGKAGVKGAAVTGEHKIKGKKYLFDEKGRLQT